MPRLGWLLRRWLVPRDPVLRVRTLGLDLPGPWGLAAGFDKDALGADALGALGFAFIEIGTVTGGEAGDELDGGIDFGGEHSSRSGRDRQCPPEITDSSPHWLARLPLPQRSGAQ